MIGVAGCGRMGGPMLDALRDGGTDAMGFDVADKGAAHITTNIMSFAPRLTTLISVVRDADQTDALLFDQHAQRAPTLDFLGHPARTAVSAAELALRYNALLIPFYGIRTADGLDFDCVMEAPIAHSDPMAMTQAMNDSLSARVRANPEQWLWVARRWRATV